MLQNKWGKSDSAGYMNWHEKETSGGYEEIRSWCTFFMTVVMLTLLLKRVKMVGSFAQKDNEEEAEREEGQGGTSRKIVEVDLRTLGEESWRRIGEVRKEWRRRPGFFITIVLLGRERFIKTWLYFFFVSELFNNMFWFVSTNESFTLKNWYTYQITLNKIRGLTLNVGVLICG